MEDFYGIDLQPETGQPHVIGSTCSIEGDNQCQNENPKPDCVKVRFMEEEPKQPSNNMDFEESICSIQEICDSKPYYPSSARRVRFEQNINLEFLQNIVGCKTENLLKATGSKKTGTDRFIPSRQGSKGNISVRNEGSKQQNNENLPESDKKQQMQFAEIYKKHVLGVSTDSQHQPLKSFKNKNYFKYSQKRIEQSEQCFSTKSIVELKQQLSITVPKASRKISKVPAKVLDAPMLQDDFYLNLLDWSDLNLLAVGLTNNVYLWNGATSKVSKLCELQADDLVTATNWAAKSYKLALGTNSGQVQIWDVAKNTKLRTFLGHQGRVGAVAWSSANTFSTGSRDKNILHRDLRDGRQYYDKLVGHKQQVCGLKWSFDHQQLASGGNDNKLLVWNNHSNTPILNFTQHRAAVKALAWSPHQHGLLVSGGGTADRTIRFWNTLKGEQINCLDVGSQVCNLMFAKTVNQLVSTHGYSLNQVNIWKYPTMKKLATLTGHTFRVLYLSMNPEGNMIVTGAGDETLRFWNVFPASEQKDTKLKSELFADSSCGLR